LLILVGLSAVSARLLEDDVRGTTPPDKGLGGRLFVRAPLLGGCGNALMLIAFRMDLPAPFTPPTSCNLGSGEGETTNGEGVPYEEDGARRPLLGRGVCAARVASGRVGMAPVLFRVFVVGIAGKAVVGGPRGGREGLGMLAAILASMRNCIAGEGSSGESDVFFVVLREAEARHRRINPSCRECVAYVFWRGGRKGAVSTMRLMERTE
jgi:hypothetical protein